MDKNDNPIPNINNNNHDDDTCIDFPDKINDWGKIKLTLITKGSDFWALLYEILDEEPMYQINENLLAESFRDYHMYGLKVQESPSMQQREAYKDSIFCRRSRYLLPCFCLKNDNVIIVIWLHQRIKNYSFDKIFIDLLNIREQYRKNGVTELPKSKGFRHELSKWYIKLFHKKESEMRYV